MKKRVLALFLAVIAILSAIPSVSAAQDPDAAGALLEKTAAAPAASAEADCPVIIGAAASANGVTVRWTSFPGAAKYCVFIRKADGGWKMIGESSTLSFEHRLVPNGTAYTYTVRAADRDGRFISLCDPAGYSFACLPAPALRKIENTTGGQRITWNAVKGASAYKVFVRSANGWTPVGVTQKTSLLYDRVLSGSRYTYTVCCWDKTRGCARSYFNKRGITATYLSAPTVSAVGAVKNGVSLRWKAVKGASRYCVFVKSGGKWKILGYTSKASFLHRNPAKNRVYCYTVRCADQKGNFISGAVTEGISFRYLAAPQITSLVNGTLRWKAASSRCGVYRRVYGKSWQLIGVTNDPSYTDRTAPRGTLYEYTVRCLDSRNRPLSYFSVDHLYYYNGNPADGSIKTGGTTRYFRNGKLRQGYVTVNGKQYYYNAKGVLQKNGLVGSKQEGRRYADKNGVIQKTYTGLAKDPSGALWYLKNGKLARTLRTAITVSGTDYVVIDGKAHKVSTEEERTLFRAMKLADRVADPKLPKERRLKLLWDYIRNAYVEKNPRIPHYHGKNWHVIYANDMLVNGVGNCMSYGAEFAFLAKAIGYDEVYACHSGGHGWAEIDGLVYDPEWSRHRFHYSYYALSYNTKTDQDYRGAISAGLWWMHVKVCGHL